MRQSSCKIVDMDMLLIIAIALSVIRLGVFVLLHAKYRTFNVLKNTVSDYGTDKSRSLYRLMSGLSLVAYAAVFMYLLADHFSPVWTVYVLGIATLGSIAILFFPTDRTGEKLTTTGLIHWALAVVNFAALFIFMTNVAIPHVATQPTIFVTFTWIVRVTFYVFLASLVLPKLRRSVMGLTERLFLVATPVWFIIFSCLLLAH